MPALDTIATKAKLFSLGDCQAVRLPESLHFSGDEVIAKRFGNGVLLLPIENPWPLMQDALGEFEPGFVLERAQPAQRDRDELSP